MTVTTKANTGVHACMVEGATGEAVPIGVCEAAIDVYARAIAGVPACDQALTHPAAVASVASYAFQAGVRAERDNAARRYISVFTEHHDADTLADTGISAQIATLGDLEAQLAAVASRATQMFRAWHDATQTGLTAHAPTPHPQLGDLLLLLSATRAAFGLTHTLTGSELARLISKEDLITGKEDTLRLHLLSEHGDLNALTNPDRLVRMSHEVGHAGCVDDTWDEGRAMNVIDGVPAAAGRNEVTAELRAILQRLDARTVRA